eukprot:1825901-Rhodomonas_salina.2
MQEGGVRRVQGGKKKTTGGRRCCLHLHRVLDLNVTPDPPNVGRLHHVQRKVEGLWTWNPPEVRLILQKTRRLGGADYHHV